MSQALVSSRTWFCSFGVLLAACGGADGAEQVTADIDADRMEIVGGVPDRGRDTAVIAIDVGGEGLCSGTLIAHDVVLTARHCVSRTSRYVECPPTAPQIFGERRADSLRILVGEDSLHFEERARGRRILVPSTQVLCGADIALVLLDRLIAAPTPLEVQPYGMAKGEFIRAVGYGKGGNDGSAGVKLLRTHIPVMDTNGTEFVVGRATCQGDSGGPAINEETGEVVGVVSRGGPSCDATSAQNIYTRTDAFASLIEEAMTAEPAPGTVKATTLDAGTRRTGASSKKPASDVGGACSNAVDCSAGVCVTDQGRTYCSRPCGTQDRCPTNFVCIRPRAGDSVCVSR